MMSKLTGSCLIAFVIVHKTRSLQILILVAKSGLSILYLAAIISPSHAAIKISINATAAEFICKNIFPTPVQIKKIIKNKIGDILMSECLLINFQQC